MSILEMDYDDVLDIASSADDVVSRCEDYIDDLTRRFSKKVDDVTGGMNDNLSTANYYVNAKKRNLEAKKSRYTSFAKNVRHLVNTAKSVDKRVADRIENNKNSFLDSNKHLKAPGIKAGLLSALTDLENWCPIFEKVGNVFDDVKEFVSDSCSAIKHWYSEGGGKEFLKFVGKIGLAALSLTIFIGTLPASGAIAIIGAIGAAMAVVDSAVDVYASWQVYKGKKHGDNALVNKWKDIGGMGDLMRSSSSAGWKVAGTFWDVSEMFCSGVSLRESWKEFKNGEKLLRGEKGLLSYMKNPEGRYTGSSIKEGFKALRKNTPLNGDAEGLRTVMWGKTKDVLKGNVKDNLKEPIKSIKSGESYRTIFSREKTAEVVKERKKVTDNFGAVKDLIEGGMDLAFDDDNGIVKKVDYGVKPFSSTWGISSDGVGFVSDGKEVIEKSFKSFAK